MKIKLAQPFAASGNVDEYDVKQMKKALNRVGYYQPYEKVGITGIPDAAVFAALKTFQKDHGLSATGAAKPDDETIDALNSEAAKTPEGHYIWRTVEDGKVRKGHAAFNLTVRSWDDEPDPGEEFNCRCWAEPIEEGLKPVYPEFFLIPALRIGRIGTIIKLFFRGLENKGFTDHGALRSNQRGASQKEIQEAIKTAKETGNITTKTGKYGTPQNVYNGPNGLMVVEETQGRNAGKIITLWWNK